MPGDIDKRFTAVSFDEPTEKGRCCEGVNAGLFYNIQNTCKPGFVFDESTCDCQPAGGKYWISFVTRAVSYNISDYKGRGYADELTELQWPANPLLSPTLTNAKLLGFQPAGGTSFATLSYPYRDQQYYQMGFFCKLSVIFLDLLDGETKSYCLQNLSPYGVSVNADTNGDDVRAMRARTTFSTAYPTSVLYRPQAGGDLVDLGISMEPLAPNQQKMYDIPDS